MAKCHRYGIHVWTDKVQAGATTGFMRTSFPLLLLLSWTLVVSSNFTIWPADLEQQHAARRAGQEQEDTFSAGVPAPAAQLGTQATITVSNETELYEAVISSLAYGSVAIILPPRTLTLTKPLEILTPTVLLGNSTFNNEPISILRCGVDGISLLALEGSALVLNGVRLEGCTRPGILISQGSNASITIVNSMFYNFSRMLAAGRVNTSEATGVAPVSDDTAALALHASSFRGTITISNTIFYGNHYRHTNGLASQATTRRQLRSERGGRLSSARSPRTGSAYAGRTSECPAGTQSGLCSGGWDHFRAGRQLHSANVRGHASWHQNEARQKSRALQQVTGLQGNNGLLLSRARLIHPELQEGPWADDMEAVVAVACSNSDVETSVGTSTQPSCKVSMDAVTIRDNTGVATGALYLLCDGMARCDFTLKDCTMERNKLLWQAAMDDYPYTDDSVWSPDNLDLPRVSDYDYGGDNDEDQPQEVPESIKLFRSMVPWLTYTYPLLELFKATPVDYQPVYPTIKAAGLMNATTYPTVTGRTLGAVVVHQRNAPSIGAEPSTPAMVSLAVTGGSFSGNDGAALMSTTTDWASMAGGYGVWPADTLPRHSADVSLTGVRVEDHASGWPAVWLRWPRTATVTDCTVVRSTGAVWLDEVRDSAVIERSAFLDNTFNQPWLDHVAFAAEAHLEGFMTGFTLGTGVIHMVKVQMTPLGALPNSVQISHCTFAGNPSYVTGTVFIRAAEEFISDYDMDNLPGTTSVKIVSSNFTSNYCRRSPGACLSGERPVRIEFVDSAHVHDCRFDDNLNGGLYVSGSGGFTVTDSSFSRNIVSYDGASPQNDPSIGGGGIYAAYIGKQGCAVISSTFTNNGALGVSDGPGGGGGAMYLMEFYFTYIYNTSFMGNYAKKGSGGAVLLMNAFEAEKSYFGARWNSTAIESCNFTDSSAGRGGGALACMRVVRNDRLSINNCSFTNSTAQLNLPNIAAVAAIVSDTQGGGAILVTDAHEVLMSRVVVSGAKALAHLGGGIHVADTERLQLTSSTIEHCSALSGGGVALTRVPISGRLTHCVLHNNSAVDPWVWPATTPVEGVAELNTLDAIRQYLLYAKLPLGYGGALFSDNGGIYVEGVGTVMTSNSALYGGAVASLKSEGVQFLGNEPSTAPSLITAAVPPFGSPAAGKTELVAHKGLIAHNTALIGGAAYIQDSTQYSIIISGMFWYNNTANGGGAIHFDGVDAPVFIHNSAFASNTAKPPPLVDGYMGLNGFEKENDTMSSLPCSGGEGGAICIRGSAGAVITMRNVTFLYNMAKSGGALSLTDGLGCAIQAKCFRVVLTNVSMTGNAASGRGGGVYAPHEGVLETFQCPSDKNITYPFLAATQAGPLSTRPNVTVQLPSRQGPTAAYYSRLSPERRAALLSHVGGAVEPTRAAAYSTGGAPQFASNVVFAVGAQPNSTVVLEDTLFAAPDAVLLPTGNLTINAGSLEPSALVRVGGLPVIVSDSILNDTEWYGVPYTCLPCADWDNFAAAGPNMATLPAFLLNTLSEPLDFYSSNTDIQIPVTVHDWLGQLCEGDDTVQPLTYVRASSPMVMGETEKRAFNGTALFRSLRLRGSEGLQNVMFTGQVINPPRDLVPDQPVEIYVRPCSINEFLSTRNEGECVACSSGSFNFNVSSATCKQCPENAECGNPDPEACQMEDCNPEGFLVPEDGYWHSSFFSDQVLECPNPDSCASDNRSDDLSALQLTVWQVARDIQLNASKPVPTSLLKQLLQEGQSTITQELFYSALVNTTRALLPEYLSAQCADGYEGPLCGVCKSGYGWSDVATCVKCPSMALNNLFYALVTLATAAMLIFTIKTSLKEQPRHGRLIGGVPSGQPENDEMPVRDHVNALAISADFSTMGSMGGQPGVVQHEGEGTPGHPAAGAPGFAASGELVSTDASFVHLELADAPMPGEALLSLPCGQIEDIPIARTLLVNNSAMAGGTQLYVSPVPPYQVYAAVPTVGLTLAPPAPADPDGTISRTSRSLSGFSLDLNNNSVISSVHANMAGPVAESVVDAEADANGAPAVTVVPDAASEDGGIAPAAEDEAGKEQVEQQPQPPRDPKYDELYGSRLRARQTTIVKMLVSYMQVLALIRIMPLDIPRVMDVYYRVNNQVISFPGNLVSLDCSLPYLPGVSAAIVRVILAALAPIYICIGTVVFMLVYDTLDYHFFLPYRNKKHKKRRPPPLQVYLGNRWGRQCIVSTIIILFFFYPNVVQALFSIFNCQDIDPSNGANLLAQAMGLQTQRVWSQDFRQECYKGPHLALVLGLGIPGLILIAVGWPVASALFVSKSLGDWEFWPTLRFTEDMTQLCLADFKQRYVWWESLVMLRKLAVAAIVTFAGAHTSAGVQLLLVMCVLALAVAAHAACMPYHHLYTNILEQVSICVLLVNIYLSLFLNADISQGARVVVSVLVLAINISMVLVFIFYITEAYWYGALFEAGLDGVPQVDRSQVTLEEVRERIIKRIMRRKSERRKKDYAHSLVSADSGELQWTDSGRSSYQHHIATVYATAVVAGLRIGETTDRVLNKVRSLRSTSSDLSSSLNSMDVETGPAHDPPGDLNGTRYKRSGSSQAPMSPSKLPRSMSDPTKRSHAQRKASSSSVE